MQTAHERASAGDDERARALGRPDHDARTGAHAPVGDGQHRAVGGHRARFGAGTNRHERQLAGFRGPGAHDGLRRAGHRVTLGMGHGLGQLDEPQPIRRCSQDAAELAEPAGAWRSQRGQSQAVGDDAARGADAEDELVALLLTPDDAIAIELRPGGHEPARGHRDRRRDRRRGKQDDRGEHQEDDRDGDDEPARPAHSRIIAQRSVTAAPASEPLVAHQSPGGEEGCPGRMRRPFMCPDPASGDCNEARRLPRPGMSSARGCRRPPDGFAVAFRSCRFEVLRVASCASWSLAS